MPRVVVVKGPMLGRTFEIEGETAFIGRSLRNDFQIRDNAISRKHLKIFRIGKKFFVEDLRSTNGTMVNDELITAGEGFEVEENDLISIGHTVLRLDELPTGSGLDIKAFKARHPKAVFGEEDRAPKDRRSRSGKDLELIYKVSELLRESLDLNEFIKKVLDYIMETLPRIDKAVILLYDTQQKQIMDIISKLREGVAEAEESYSQSVVEKVLQGGKPVRMSNVDYEKAGDFEDSTHTMQMGSVMCVPMISNSELRGVIYVDSRRAPYGFRKEDLMLLNTLSGPVALSIEKAMLTA